MSILPEETAKEFTAGGTVAIKKHENITVLFAQFQELTSIASAVTLEKVVKEINDCFSAFDTIMAKYKIEKIRSNGSTYMAAGGLSKNNANMPADVINAAIEIRSVMRFYKQNKLSMGEPFIEMRIGVHSGPAVSAMVGSAKFQFDIWGEAVDTAAHLAVSGEVGKINISKSTHESVADKFLFVNHIKENEPGKEAMNMYFVEGPVIV